MALVKKVLGDGGGSGGNGVGSGGGLVVTISIITTAIHTISDILTIICFITIVSNNQQSKKLYLHKIGHFLIESI